MRLLHILSRRYSVCISIFNISTLIHRWHDSDGNKRLCVHVDRIKRYRVEKCDFNYWMRTNEPLWQLYGFFLRRSCTLSRSICLSLFHLPLSVVCYFWVLFLEIACKDDLWCEKHDKDFVGIGRHMVHELPKKKYQTQHTHGKICVVKNPNVLIFYIPMASFHAYCSLIPKFVYFSNVRAHSQIWWRMHNNFTRSRMKIDKMRVHCTMHFNQGVFEEKRRFFRHKHADERTFEIHTFWSYAYKINRWALSTEKKATSTKKNPKKKS